VPIQSVPVDQAAFSRMMLIAIEPKTDRDSGIQYTSKDGSEKKWNVQVVASLPSRWDADRTESDVVNITLSTAEDPTGYVSEGDQVAFTDLVVGVVAPTKDEESGRIKGGRLFWQASGVHSRIPAGGKS
jgi:hypothetical protein